MAHRHGRATFNLAFDRTQDGETTNIIIRHSTDRATVIRSRDRSKPTLVHELTFDDAYQAETAAVLQVTTADIANYTRLVTEIEAGIPAFLAAIEHGDNRSYIGTLPYILLAAPYADEELPIAAGFVQGD
jgi:hypothetical protein